MGRRTNPAGACVASEIHWHGDRRRAHPRPRPARTTWTFRFCRGGALVGGRLHRGILCPASLLAFGLLRRLLVSRARKVVSRLLAQHDPAGFRQETDDQADLLPRPACGVPRDPQPVAVTELRFVVVRGELFAGKDVLAVGLDVIPVLAVLLKRVNDKRAVDLHRLLLVTVIEQEPAVEAPLLRPIRLLR